MFIRLMVGMDKLAQARWIQNLMSMKPGQMQGLLNSWDDVAKRVGALGEGARNITRDKAAYKALANKARGRTQQIFTAANDPERLKHVYEVARINQAGEGARNWVRQAGDLMPGHVSSMAGMDAAGQAMYRRSVLAALQHDWARPFQSGVDKALVKANPRLLHHTQRGAEMASDFMRSGSNRRLVSQAGLGAGLPKSQSAVRDITDAIRAHSPELAQEGIPRVADLAQQPLSKRLRASDLIQGNFGRRGAETTFNFGRNKTPDDLARSKRAWDYARQVNLPAYQQEIAAMPQGYQAMAREQLARYYQQLGYAQQYGRLPQAGEQLPGEILSQVQQMMGA